MATELRDKLKSNFKPHVGQVVIWGLLLKGGEGRGVDAGMFQWFFVSVLGGAVVLSSLIARLPEDKAHPVEPIVIGNAILRPFRAMTYLASLVEPPKRPDGPKGPPAD
mgnify:CR=1 FL=1